MRSDETVNILMVDDQPSKLLSYEVMLGGLGENLIKANSAKAALEILLKTEVAVVLMDVFMVAVYILGAQRASRFARDVVCSSPNAWTRVSRILLQSRR